MVPLIQSMARRGGWRGTEDCLLVYRHSDLSKTSNLSHLEILLSPWPSINENDRSMPTQTLL